MPRWLFIFDTPRGIKRLPWKLLIFQFKTQSFSETGLSLKLISLFIFVLTGIFAMDIKNHVYLYIFCYIPRGIKYKQPPEHPIFNSAVITEIQVLKALKLWRVFIYTLLYTYILNH